MPPTSAPHGSPLIDMSEPASVPYATPETLLAASHTASPYQQRTYVQNDSFYTFDDFAQSLLNPSSNTWHSDSFNQSEDQYSRGSLSSQPMVPQTPHTISTVNLETPALSEAFTFEPNEIVERGVSSF